jgi:2-aminoadipate transaminase
MEKGFPKGITCARPQGGLFAWAELSANINARDVLEKSLEKNIGFVPGG